MIDLIPKPVFGLDGLFGFLCTTQNKKTPPTLLYVTHNQHHPEQCTLPRTDDTPVIDPSLIREVEARMNRNYLPPSLMHTGHNSSNMSSSCGSGAGLHHPQPQLESIQDEDDDDSTEMTETVPVGVDVTQNGTTNVVHQQQSPQYQIHQLYGAFNNNNNNQGTSTALPQQPMHAASVSSVISPSSSSSALSNPPATTTRRSVSFTGGVPIVSHPFQHQYTHMLPPMAPQMAHQSSTYQYQQSMGQVVAGGGNGTGTPPNQPIRLGRIDRFSRTCKLPTVQEVGKLKWATS